MLGGSKGGVTALENTSSPQGQGLAPQGHPTCTYIIIITIVTGGSGVGPRPTQRVERPSVPGGDGVTPLTASMGQPPIGVPESGTSSGKCSGCPSRNLPELVRRFLRLNKHQTAHNSQPGSSRARQHDPNATAHRTSRPACATTLAC